MTSAVDDDKKKIAYATSFAHNDPQIPTEEIPILKNLLRRFDGISIRENEGVNILKNKFGINSVQNIDPVFLCGDDDWSRISDEAERKTDGEFLFAYILDPTGEKIQALKGISSQLGLPIVSVTDKQYNAAEKIELLHECGILTKASISELIYHLKNASFVVTDSYHGTCFSLIFRKTFITIINTKRGKSRFDTLDELFGVGSRFVKDAVSILGSKKLLENMDYSKISPKIKKAVNRGKEWLNDQLTGNM